MKMKRKHLQWVSYTMLAAGLSLSSLSAAEGMKKEKTWSINPIYVAPWHLSSIYEAPSYQDSLVDITNAAPEDIPTVVDLEGNPLPLFTEVVETQEEAPANDPSFDAEIAFEILNEEREALITLLRDVRSMLLNPIFRAMEVDLHASSYIQRAELFSKMESIQRDINRLTEEEAEILETTIEVQITYAESFREQLVQYLIQKQNKGR